MTKAQIELLMTRDVDDVSETAVHLPRKQLGITLKNASAMLAREEQPTEVEERLFIFKLLRFVQAVLAGAREPVTAEVAREVFRSAQSVMKRNIAPDVNRSAQDMLSVLLTEKTQRELLQNQFVSTADIVAIYQLRSDEPLRYFKAEAGQDAYKAVSKAAAPKFKALKKAAAPKVKQARQAFERQVGRGLKQARSLTKDALNASAKGLQRAAKKI